MVVNLQPFVTERDINLGLYITPLGNTVQLYVHSGAHMMRSWCAEYYREVLSADMLPSYPDHSHFLLHVKKRLIDFHDVMEMVLG